MFICIVFVYENNIYIIFGYGIFLNEYSFYSSML